MSEDFQVSSSMVPVKLEFLSEHPDELYEWDDFMKYFPIMQGKSSYASCVLEGIYTPIAFKK